MHGVPRESISFFKRQSKTICADSGAVPKLDAMQKWDSKNYIREDQDVTLSDDNNEGSLVLMTCEEFE